MHPLTKPAVYLNWVHHPTSMCLFIFMPFFLRWYYPFSNPICVFLVGLLEMVLWHDTICTGPYVMGDSALDRILLPWMRKLSDLKFWIPKGQTQPKHKLGFIFPRYVNPLMGAPATVIKHEGACFWACVWWWRCVLHFSSGNSPGRKGVPVPPVRPLQALSFFLGPPIFSHSTSRSNLLIQ